MRWALFQLRKRLRLKNTPSVPQPSGRRDRCSPQDAPPWLVARGRMIIDTSRMSVGTPRRRCEPHSGDRVGAERLSIPANHRACQSSRAVCTRASRPHSTCCETKVIQKMLTVSATCAAAWLEGSSMIWISIQTIRKVARPDWNYGCVSEQHTHCF